MWLSKAFERLHQKNDPEISRKIRKMEPYRYMGNFYFPLVVFATAVDIYFYPPIGLFVLLVELVLMAFWTNEVSDKIFNETIEK